MKIPREHVEAIYYKLDEWGNRIDDDLEDLVAEFDTREGDDPGRNRLPGFRGGDPSTSRKAALDAYPRSGSNRFAALRAVWSLRQHGATYEDVGGVTGINGVWKRLSELKQGGWIESRGTRKVSTGSEADIYYPTQKTKDYYR